MDFVTRASWGARPSRYELAYIRSTRGVKIHYEGVYVPPSLVDDHGECDDRVRAIQRAHLSNNRENYSDIAYNLLVCPHGYVYEGRGAHRKTGANGNGTLNAHHYAVCALLGSSGLDEPTDAMLHGLVDAIEYLRGNGDAGNDVAGHRDGYPTACPGAPLYAWVRDGAKRPDGTRPQGGASGPVGDGGHPPRYRKTIGGLEYGYGAHGDHVTQVGRALVARGHGDHYRVGPGPNWTDADTLNYAAWQRSLGYRGADADGVPGEASLGELLGELPGAEADVPPFPGRDAFRLGHRDPAVEQLDRQLIRRGFTRHHDGDGYQAGPRFTVHTRANVADFQRSDSRLAGDPDGYPGPLTWQLLHS